MRGNVIAIDPGQHKSGYVEFLRGRLAVSHPKWIDNESLATFLDGYGWHHNPLDMMVQEDFVNYGGPVGRSTTDSIRWSGIFAQAFGRGRSVWLSQPQIRAELFRQSGLTPKEIPRNLWPCIVEMYGGKDVAIGGKKCDLCKGKGYRGRPRAICECEDGLSTPRGPLHRVSKITKKEGHDHVRSAVAVGVAYLLSTGTERAEFMR